MSPRRARDWLALQVAVLVFGALPAAAQTVREIPLPITTFPAGIAVAPDGAVWISIMQADRLLRFDPGSGHFTAFNLSLQSLPRGLAVDGRGRVWFAATGRGYIGRLDPTNRKVEEFALPSIIRPGGNIPVPWALALSRREPKVWSTVHSTGMLASVPVDARPVRRGFVVSEMPITDPLARPDGVAIGGDGRVWVAAFTRDEVLGLDPKGGTVVRVKLASGSRPRAVAAAPGGEIWVTLFGTNHLLRIEPATLATRAWPLPGGEGAAPTAITIDRHGVIWIAEYESNAIVRFDPTTGGARSFVIGTSRARPHAIAADALGRIWYVGAFAGRLGVIEP